MTYLPYRVGFMAKQFIFLYAVSAKGKPVELIDALTSLEARRVYAEKHGVAVAKVIARCK
jgi:hypothetical protein